LNSRSAFCGLASLVSGEPVINEVRLRRADGQYRWHLIHGVPLCDASGNIVKWYGAAADIEDRKRIEQALRRSERELRDLIEIMPAMAVAALPDGSRTFANRRWTEYTGLSAEDTAVSHRSKTAHYSITSSATASSVISKPNASDFF
jgi:PAS domain-containing protein